jgi:plastocyanin
VHRRPIRWSLLLAVLGAVGCVPLTAAQAATKPVKVGKPTNVRTPDGTITTQRMSTGVRHMTFRYGPVRITPGQNTINIAPTSLHPPTDGYIKSFKPDLTYANGKVPPVDVIHLHHAVWLVNGAPTWAAGEEKTIVRTPGKFGWRYKTTDGWLLNHMIHNLYPTPTNVFITWTMDFVPDSSKAAKGLREVTTRWMDVAGLRAYPVFDALRGSGKNGRFTYPDDDPNPRRAGAQSWVADHDATLVGTAGHLHPGGLYTDLKITRGGRTKTLFRSRAKYYEPAGAVSWDVSMTATPADWRVAIKKGDVLSVSGTYDTRHASWYESMAIMPVAITKAYAGGADPFVTNVNRGGTLTHGHLRENDNHGGEGQGSGLANVTKLADGPAEAVVNIKGFKYQQGDLSQPGAKGLPPTVRAGQPLTFVNDEAATIMHSITACRTPCNGAAGIAYPLANGLLSVESGNLGFGPRGFTAASNRQQWQTPTNLSAGTYTYFCRIHPFMRGAFRVQA